MIKNIIFDMGGVLIDYKYPEKAKAAAKNETEKQFFIKEIYGNVEWVQADRGIITFREAIKSCQKRLPSLTNDQVDRIIKTAHNPMTEFIGMYDIVKQLKQNGYELYVLSNAPDTHVDFEKIIRTFELFDKSRLFFSCDYKMLKPEREIYKAFLEKFSLIPNESVFIDDNAINVEGAIFAKINGILFDGDIEKLKSNLKNFNINI